MKISGPANTKTFISQFELAHKYTFTFFFFIIIIIILAIAAVHSVWLLFLRRFSLGLILMLHVSGLFDVFDVLSPPEALHFFTLRDGENWSELGFPNTRSHILWQTHTHTLIYIHNCSS